MRISSMQYIDYVLWRIHGTCTPVHLIEKAFLQSHISTVATLIDEAFVQSDNIDDDDFVFIA